MNEAQELADEIGVALAFAREFWPQGLIRRWLAAARLEVLEGSIGVAEARKIARVVIETTVKAEKARRP